MTVPFAGVSIETAVRTILDKGKVRPRSVIIVGIRGQSAAQIALVEDNNIVEALAANRADSSLDIGILPGRSGHRDDLFDAHCPDALAEVLAI